METIQSPEGEPCDRTVRSDAKSAWPRVQEKSIAGRSQKTKLSKNAQVEATATEDAYRRDVDKKVNVSRTSCQLV